jgi:hypothetical protein
MQDHDTILSVLSEENIDVDSVPDLMAAREHAIEKEAAKLRKEEQRRAKGKDKSHATDESLSTYEPSRAYDEVKDDAMDLRKVLKKACVARKNPDDLRFDIIVCDLSADTTPRLWDRSRLNSMMSFVNGQRRGTLLLTFALSMRNIIIIC